MIGPSVVRALPIAAGTNESGQYFRSIKNRMIAMEKNFGDPTNPLNKPILTGKWKKMVHFCGWGPGHDFRGAARDI